MKKNILFFCLCLLASSYTFAQKVIENPEYGYSTVPGEITKVELLDTTTVLHFHLKYIAGGRFGIPTETYIQDLSSSEKLFVTNAKGVKLGRNIVPDSGEILYQLYFPALNKNVKTIEFGEANNGGNWFVYDIVIQEGENATQFPIALRGNWLLADGSNRWDYGFNSKNAIVEEKIWTYKSIENKGKKYTITLERDGNVKTITAKLGKNGIVAFGDSPKSLKEYSLKKVYNPDFKMKDDKAFEAITFALDSTTYSGVIKGFSEKVKQKTAMVHVNNPFKGDQESHLIKINNDGSFKVKFPITHPQTVFVRMQSGGFYVFVEPNKETFHYLYNKESFFMGDNAQINAGLEALKDVNFILSRKERNEIGITSPEDYKILCIQKKENVVNKILEFQKHNFISKKALQLKNTEIELEFYQGLLAYSMYRGSLEYRNKKAKEEKDKLPFKAFEVSNDYYNFLPKDILDNELLALSGSYYFLTNYIVYADIFRVNRLPNLNTVDRALWLKNKGVELTTDELNMVEFSKQIETPEMIAKKEEFEKVYGDTRQAFYKKYNPHFEEISKYIKSLDQPTHDFILSVVDYLKTKNIEITEEEAKMVSALEALKTPIEIEQQRQFYEQFAKANITFNNKYIEHASEISRERRALEKDKKIEAFFGRKDSFMQDVMMMQAFYKTFEDYKVFDNRALEVAQAKLNITFLKDYLAFTNEETKAKIELNKTKGGYTVHNIEKSEGDELFEAMIKKFKGKVVYVDFWATWCGPCKSGIKRIAPLKEELVDEDVVFLYVTNQTSPEGTWRNSIANIKGEHYRVSADEWNYLKEKFKISGIPHYVLVNKKGEIVKPKMAYLSNSGLKRIFKAELSK
ncbi:TlpA disulfide reductase family protein [Seonamhaeicola sp. ML3]|uniref:TlpA family protein disulfide reductase n=1 Tax=Seonamhaeicola sp. ML3 TaxID=2937786 RepID=UPI00200E1DD3|nr:TlpA disulfide reductase family protein [Seonamhaeicola sp. ML3]